MNENGLPDNGILLSTTYDINFSCTECRKKFSAELKFCQDDHPSMVNITAVCKSCFELEKGE